jgi:hypothetical protein
MGWTFSPAGLPHRLDLLTRLELLTGWTFSPGWSSEHALEHPAIEPVPELPTDLALHSDQFEPAGLV